MPQFSPATVPRIPHADPRLKPGAYITDGKDLYWVHGATGAPMSLEAKVLVVEDCRTNWILELDRVETTCTLVRVAPNP